MISVLAKFFRGLHMFVGITPPPEGHNERTFVLVWLGGMASIIVICALLFVFIAEMYRF